MKHQGWRAARRNISQSEERFASARPPYAQPPGTAGSCEEEGEEGMTHE